MSILFLERPPPNNFTTEPGTSGSDVYYLCVSAGPSSPLDFVLTVWDLGWNVLDDDYCSSVRLLDQGNRERVLGIKNLFYLSFFVNNLNDYHRDKRLTSPS